MAGRFPIDLRTKWRDKGQDRECPACWSGIHENSWFGLNKGKIQAELIHNDITVPSRGVSSIRHTGHIPRAGNIILPWKPPRSPMFDLIHLTKKWLQPETISVLEVVERVVMDCYRRDHSCLLRKWGSHGDPKTAEQLVDLVEKILRSWELTKCRWETFQRSGKTVPVY